MFKNLLFDWLATQNGINFIHWYAGEATFKVELSFVMLKIKLGVNFSIFKRMAHLVTQNSRLDNKKE